MGVSVLAGTADGTNTAAAMYCNTTGWMVGPIFEAPDAVEQIEAFLAWLGRGVGLTLRSQLNLGEPRAGALGTDPREWDDGALERLVRHWRSLYVGEDGWLLDDMECACGKGHHHLDEDGATARGEAAQECASCDCREWKPGNQAAAAAAKEDA